MSRLHAAALALAVPLVLATACALALTVASLTGPDPQLGVMASL